MTKHTSLTIILNDDGFHDEKVKVVVCYDPYCCGKGRTLMDALNDASEQLSVMMKDKYWIHHIREVIGNE